MVKLKTHANGRAAKADPTPAPGAMPGELTLPHAAIAPSPLNPRKHFAEDALAELAASLAADGMLEPIVVRPIPPGAAGAPRGAAYWIVAGERRWRAAALAGLAQVPVRILDGVDDVQHLRLALVENLQREDLDPIEEAAGYRELHRVAGLRQAEIAAAVRRSQPAVANRLRLLDLPEDVQDLIRARQLTPAHGIALARFKAFPKVASALAKIAVERTWTSKHLEQGLPQSWELAQAGLVASLATYEAKFDVSVCRACPFGANVDNMCLNLEHYRQLQREAAEARKAEVARLEEQAKVKGEAALSLKTLGHGNYVDFGYRTRPSGCSEACPCSKQALNYSGEVETVCVDPKRYNGLVRADEKAAGTAKRAEGRAQVERLTSALDALDAPTSRELAVLVAKILQDVRAPSMVREAADRRVPGLLLVDAKGSRHGWEDRVEELARLAPTDLVKLAFEALLRYELYEIYESSYSFPGAGKLAKWYLGEPARAEADPDDGPLSTGGITTTGEAEAAELRGESVGAVAVEATAADGPETVAGIVLDLPDEHAADSIECCVICRATTEGVDIVDLVQLETRAPDAHRVRYAHRACFEDLAISQGALERVEAPTP